MKKILSVIIVLTILTATTFSLNANAFLKENNNKDMPQEHIDSFCKYLTSVFTWISLEEQLDTTTYKDFTKVCNYNEYTIYRYEWGAVDHESTAIIGPVIFRIDSAYSDYYREDQYYEGTGLYLINDKEALSLSQAYEAGKIDLLHADELLNNVKDYYNYYWEYKTDLDKNERLDVRDVTLLQKFIVDNTDGSFNVYCDFNYDRTVNVNDVTALQKCIAGYNILYR